MREKAFDDVKCSSFNESSQYCSGSSVTKNIGPKMLPPLRKSRKNALRNPIPEPITLLHVAPLHFEEHSHCIAHGVFHPRGRTNVEPGTTDKIGNGKIFVT
jgi:hypothetical protein